MLLGPAWKEELGLIMQASIIWTQACRDSVQRYPGETISL